MRLRHVRLEAALRASLPSLICAASLAAAACGPAQQSAPPVVVAVAPAGPAPPLATVREPQRAEPEAEPAPSPASEDPVLRARDARKLTATPRSPQLLTVEIEQLERLFATMSTSAPDRPMLLRRLADSNVELSRALQNQRGSDAGRAASQRAILHYDRIVADHPSFGQKDEVLYYAALEHEVTGNLREARRRYYELIKSSPQSKHIPGAYFAFGEMFFAEAEREPSKLPMAEQAYAEALKYPPPANAVYGLALVRAAEVAERTGNAQKAAQLRAKVDQLPPGDPGKTLRRR
jgi:TolA-binding protein